MPLRALGSDSCTKELIPAAALGQRAANNSSASFIGSQTRSCCQRSSERSSSSERRLEVAENQRLAIRKRLRKCKPGRGVYRWQLTCQVPASGFLADASFIAPRPNVVCRSKGKVGREESP
jgi:hypothetical protein